ncbi:MAG: PAS domain-containing protein, partial [Candidatus Margulisiibacteriota bacterium]
MSLKKKILESPISSFLLVLAVVFICEMIIMFFLGFFPELRPSLAFLLDSVFLVVLVAPIMFFLLIKPIVSNASRVSESEKWFRAVYEASPIGKEVYNEKGELQEANPACLEIFGVDDPREIKG